MSLPREVARLALSSLNSTLNTVRLIVWVPIGLLLFVGIARTFLGPVFSHLATYWWVYLLGIGSLVAVFVYLLSRDISDDRKAELTVIPLSNSVLQATQVSLQAQVNGKKSHSANGRPTSGLALYRYTEDWLTRNGMYEGQSISKVDAIETAGRSAISYHLREGNFVEQNGGIMLTAKGQAHFEKRRSRL